MKRDPLKEAAELAARFGRIKKLTEYGELLDDLYELQVRAAALLKKVDRGTVNGEDPGRLTRRWQSFLFFLPGLRRAMHRAKRVPQYTGEKDRKITVLNVVFAEVLSTIDQFQDKNMRLWVIGMETRQITVQSGGFGTEESIHRSLPRNG